MSDKPGMIKKLAWSLPWLARYPFWRAREMVRRGTEAIHGSVHLIFVVANHFEPGWDATGRVLDWNTQLTKLDRWCELARAIGQSVRDADGTLFRHTNFYPAEQYHPRLLQRLADLQAEGLGEVEVHLHHGVEKPDNAENLKRVLTEFRDVLAEEHKCLSRFAEDAMPRYAFVHGNLALANSAGNRYCGVDSEMRILADTGCYADMTLPSAPDQSQVARINAIYQCGNSLDEARSHRSGPNLKVRDGDPQLPIIFTGPLVFNWQRRVHGLPVPRIDDGALTTSQGNDIARLDRWKSARIHVEGRPEWIFIKLYCHGFFDFDQTAAIGDGIHRFWDQAIEFGERTNAYKVHFASAREAFNMVVAATDGCEGEPGNYRDYRLRQIMQREVTCSTGTEG